MDLSFILLILGFIIVSVLIFKLIKKIIFAVVTFVVLIILVISGVFGLVYLDYNHLASQSDFDIYLMYGDSENPQFGVSLAVKNKTLDTENIKKYEIGNLENLDLNKIEENFYIFFSQDLLSEILSENDKYYLEGTDDLIISGIGINAGLTKKEILDILSSNNPKDKYIDYIIAKNDIPSLLEAAAKVSAEKYIDNSLNEVNLNIKEALFLSLIKNNILSDKTNAIKIVQGFKNDELEVYPDRLTFKLVRMLPADVFADNIPSFEE